jgi:hypothetical protein
MICITWLCCYDIFIGGYAMISFYDEQNTFGNYKMEPLHGKSKGCLTGIHLCVSKSEGASQPRNI